MFIKKSIIFVLLGVLLFSSTVFQFIPPSVSAAATDCAYQQRSITQPILDLIEENGVFPGGGPTDDAIRFYTNLRESGVEWLFVSCPEAPEGQRLFILSYSYEDGDEVLEFNNLGGEGQADVQIDSLDESNNGLSIEDTNEAEDFIDRVHEDPDSIDDTAGVLDGTDEPVDREPPADEGEGDEEDETPKCEEDLDWTDYQWVPCLFLTTVDIFVNEAIDAVNSMLAVEPEEVNDDGLKQAWSYFRNIASLLLVVIGLAMIIGQGISKE